MLAIICTLLIFLLTLMILLNWQYHTYWKMRRIPTPFYLPFLGHLHQLLGLRWINIDQMYKQFKSHGCWGLYQTFNPILFVSDPALIKDITVKDFDHFVDRRPFPFSGSEGYLSEMLFALDGEKWKTMRNLITPTFSSGKMKGMFPLISTKADELILECGKEMEKHSFLNINKLVGYYTLDTIATCAFGIDAKCIQTKEDSLFFHGAKNIFKTDFLNTIKFTIMCVAPSVYKFLGLHIGGDFTYLDAVLQKTIEHRETSQKRGDFLDIILEIFKENASGKYAMNMEMLKAHCFMFILAGSDTTAGSLGLVFYPIAQHPQVQNRLRKELDQIIERDGELNYQNLMEAPYLDACINEAMRLYPSAHYLERKCTKKYTISSHGLEIPKDMLVDIPLWSLHHDPEYFEDPETFQPERFLPENKDKIKPYTFFPFGLGPRNCIGNRFVLLVEKIIVAKMILNFELSLRPGFKEVSLECFFDTLRPDEKGVEVILKKIPQK